MNIEGFKQFGKEKNFSEEIIAEATKIAQDFNDFLKDVERDIDSANTSDVKQYAEFLIDTDRNKKNTFFGLIRYTYFSGNDEMLITLYELLDGSDVLENLKRELQLIVGEEKSKGILKGISFPPLGTISENKPIITKQVIERLVENVDERNCHKILTNNLHGIPKENYKGQREIFLKTEDVDLYLKERHENFIKTLEKHRDEQTLFYTQEVDNEVIDHVRNNPQIEGGVRKGNIVYAEKIPYMTKKFLHETDEKMKQYYYCHCGWVREALKTGEVKVPSTFCKCSAGYYKNQWEVILDQPIEVEVVETILDNNPRCLFAIHLPEKYVK